MPKMKPATNEVAIALPLGGPEEPGYQAQLIDGGEVGIEVRGVHLNVQLGRRAAAAFVKVRNGLRDGNAKLPDGKPVFSNADALRYVFELVADSVD